MRPLCPVQPDHGRVRGARKLTPCRRAATRGQFSRGVDTPVSAPAPMALATPAAPPLTVDRATVEAPSCSAWAPYVVKRCAGLGEEAVEVLLAAICVDHADSDRYGHGADFGGYGLAAHHFVEPLG